MERRGRFGSALVRLEFSKMAAGFYLTLLLAQVALLVPAAASIVVSSTSNASPIGLSAFVSFSIELASFPLFAGTLNEAWQVIFVTRT